MKTKALPFLLVGTLLIGGCATSQKIQVVQSGDDELSCDQIKQALVNLDESQTSVDENKGVTGTNVASVLFWLPGLAYTYYDAGQATELIQQRRSHLTEISNKNSCN